MGLERFLAEARILAKLEHPNIVRVHRIIAAARGTAYMVMEYVEGRSLREELGATGTLSETQVRSVLVALTAGLELVHAKRLLHRDIKPANVMLRAKDGVPVLIDFGAARQVIGQQSRSVTSVLTPGYAPIELYETHGHQGPWTDIYALGALAYVALTGRVPEDATSRVRNDRLPPLTEVAESALSGGLATAVAAALRVNESDRPQSLEAWRTLLDASDVGEEVAPIGEEGAPIGEEVAPIGEEGAPIGEEGAPASVTGEVVSHPTEPESSPARRWQLYAVAAGIAGTAVLGVLLTIGDRTGGDGATEADAASVTAVADGDANTGTPSGASRDGGGADAGAAMGTAVADGNGTDSATEIGSDDGTGGAADDLDDVAQVEAALGLDREARRVVQEGLVTAGFDPGTPDGFFGDRTRAALREWQAEAGIAETGFLDRAAVEALTERQLADEALADEALADEALADEALADEALADEALADEALEPLPPPRPDPAPTTRPETTGDTTVPTPAERNPPSTVGTAGARDRFASRSPYNLPQLRRLPRDGGSAIGHVQDGFHGRSGRRTPRAPRQRGRLCHWQVRGDARRVSVL